MGINLREKDPPGIIKAAGGTNSVAAAVAFSNKAHTSKQGEYDHEGLEIGR